MRKLILIFVLFLSSLAFADANLVFYADFNDNADTNVVVNQITTPAHIDAIDACYVQIVGTDINSVAQGNGSDTNSYMIFTAIGDYTGARGNNLTYRQLTSIAAGTGFRVSVAGNDSNAIIVFKRATNIDPNNYTLTQLKTLLDACDGSFARINSTITGDGNATIKPVTALRYLTGGVDACEYNVANDAYYINSSGPKYLMACHDANKSGIEVNDLYLLTSEDCNNWHLISPAGGSYSPPTYSLRDPSIVITNSAYYVCYTMNDSNTTFRGHSIGIAMSSDLATWTHITDVNLCEAVTYIWAPEWFVEPNGTVHIFVRGWAVLREIHPVIAGDFNNWSAPVSLSIDGIDPFIVQKSGDPNYHLWFQEWSSDPNFNTYIAEAESLSLTSGYSIQHRGNWTGWGANKEGICVVSLGGNNWRAFLQPTIGAVYYSDSNDNQATWTAPVICTHDGGALNLGHGTVINYGSGSWTSQHSVTGKVGTALSFDGNTYVDCNNTYQQNALTITGWVKANDGQPSSLQIIYSRTISDGNHFEIYLGTDGIFDANCFVGGVEQTVTLYQNGGSVSALADGNSNWIMLTAVMPDCNISGTGNLLIGSSFSGSLDDLRIYNKALSADEVKALYEKLCPKPAGDLNGDCQVDFFDFAVLADSYVGSTENWLKLKDIADTWLACGLINQDNCWQ